MATGWKYLANTKKEREGGKQKEEEREREKIEREGRRKEGELALRIEIG